MQIRTEISPVSDETYDTIGGLQDVEHPEQENFKQLLFTFKFKYSNRVENVQTELTSYFRELLTSDVYWTGGGYEYDDTDRNEYIHRVEATIYMGDISEEELVERLSKGTLIVTWMEDGEEKREELNLGENVVFLNR